MLTLISLYSGGGVADIGFKQAGFNLVAAVERDSKIAHYHNLNLDNHCINASVDEVDYTQFKGVDCIFMSPPCRASSIANPNRGEDHPDWMLGEQAIRAIEKVKPKWVILENVRGYVDNPAFKAICAALAKLDYYFDYRILDCADLGVPQHRKRLILLASLDGFFLFPQFVEVWQSWYAAIKDLLDGCEDSDLPNWTRKKLLEKGVDGRLLISDQNATGSPIWEDGRPSFTLTARYGHRVLLPLLCDGQNVSGNPFTPKNKPSACVTASHGGKRVLLPRAGVSNKVIPTPNHEPSPTVRALEKGRHSHLFDAVSIKNECYEVKKLSPRCIARLMSVPDTYILPEAKSLAVTILGNGFPSLAAYRIGQWIINQSKN